MTVKTAPRGVLPSGLRTGQRLVLKLVPAACGQLRLRALPGLSLILRTAECRPYVVEEAEAETR